MNISQPGRYLEMPRGLAFDLVPPPPPGPPVPLPDDPRAREELWIREGGGATYSEWLMRDRTRGAIVAEGYMGPDYWVHLPPRPDTEEGRG